MTELKQTEDFNQLCQKGSFVVVLFLSAITMVAAITLSTYALVSSNQGMDSVMLEIQQLQMQDQLSSEPLPELQSRHKKSYLYIWFCVLETLYNTISTSKQTSKLSTLLHVLISFGMIVLVLICHYRDTTH